MESKTKYIFSQMLLKGFRGSPEGGRGLGSEGILGNSGVFLFCKHLVWSAANTKLHQLESLTETGYMEASSSSYQCD